MARGSSVVTQVAFKTILGSINFEFCKIIYYEYLNRILVILIINEIAEDI